MLCSLRKKKSIEQQEDKKAKITMRLDKEKFSHMILVKKSTTLVTLFQD